MDKPLLVKMYGILFADAAEEETQELYRAFQIRNGLFKEVESSLPTGTSEQSAPPPVDHTEKEKKETVAAKFQ